MAFFEDRFPPKISTNMTGGPRFLTDKAFTAGGQRATNRRSQFPLHEYSLAQPIREGSLFEELRAFFYVVGGDADAFRFKDWSDYQATQLNSSLSLVTGDIFRLNRVYTFGARTFSRPIYKPVLPLQIFRTRAALTTDTTFSTTLDVPTGLVTVTDHEMGDTYTWVGEFDVPVAFRDPAAVFQVLGGPRMLTEWPNIDLEEVRL